MTLARQLESAGVSEWVEEFRFHPTRKWRFDFAWPHARLAVEVEGGVWNRGRHTRGSGFVPDCEKYNEAVMHGWRVLRYAPHRPKSGATWQHEAAQQIKSALEGA